MRARGLAAAVLVLAGCSVTSSASSVTTTVPVASASPPSSTASPSRPRALSGDSVEFLTYDGVERRYVLHVPTDLPDGASVPLVLVLHGAGGVPEEIIVGSGWNTLADERGLIVAYPAGDDESWNAGACCGVAASEGHDDVGFLNALIAHLTGFAQVDPARVVVAGHSNGGMMAYRLACDPAARVMGAASVAGTNMAGCQPARPIAFLEIHGTADVIVPYEGGSTRESESVGLPPFTPVEVSIEWMVEALGCAAEPDETAESRNTTTTWTGCAGETRVQLVTLGGAGHSWPTGRTYEATPAIADFFFGA
jgi:polyhydroxybutyrate depolymerase